MRNTTKTASVILPVVALAAGAAAAMTVPAGAGVGVQSSPPIVAQVEIESPATLVARGAAIDVPVLAQCTTLEQARGTGFVFVTVRQRVGSAIASGSGSTSFTCAGFDGRVITVRVLAESKAFKKGTAAAEGSIDASYSSGYWFVGSVSATDSETISIAR